MSLDLTSLEAAVVQLKEALALCSRESYKSDPLMRRHLRAAAIQAFEYTYEISIKMIIRYMKKTIIGSDEINNMTFDNFIREAFGKDLVLSDVTAWRYYKKQRNITSHTYNEGKAQEVFETIPDFLKEAQYVLARLQERNESLDQPD